MGARVRTDARSRHIFWQRIKDWRPGAERRGRWAAGDSSRWHELRAIVQAYGLLRADRVDLPGTNVTLRITRPYPVISSRYHAPYWSYIWPSGVVLAGAIARDPDALQGKRVLELGPGVGVTAVAALQAGADLVVADAVADSLAFCAFNGLDQAGIEPKTVRIDWRQPNRELFAVAGEGFSLVLAADVLYDVEDVKPLLALLDRVVAPGGELWLAEPGRMASKQWVTAICERGWRGTHEQCDSPWPDPIAPTLNVVTLHRLRRSSASP
jgi:2-polyprenyl-3-methyl-5-hydroxy-6-metoxy-1,4-benzoquinol methylase